MLGRGIFLTDLLHTDFITIFTEITIPSSGAKNHNTTRVYECDLLICSI